MENGKVDVVKKDKIARVTISNPKKLNALNIPMIMQLREIFWDLNKDDNISIVVITGEGDRAFSVGADIQNFDTLSSPEGYRLMKLGYDVHSLMDRMEKVLIAVVKGYCLAGGCEIILACDLVLATEDSSFSLPEITLGIIPGWGGTIRLPKVVPLRKAKELILTGDRISAREAEKIGLVSRIAPKEELEGILEELLMKLGKRSPLALRLAKNSINYGLQCSDWDSALAVERGSISVLFGSRDCQEGVNAFLSKRAANFTGE